MNNQHRKDVRPDEHIVTGFVQTMYFDLQFNYLRGTVEQVNISTTGSANWESEICKVVPHVRYEYTRVSKKNPEISGSGLARIKRAQEKVKLLAANKGASLLKIVTNTVVTKFHPIVKENSETHIFFLEQSFDRLKADEIAVKRKTRDIPRHLQEKAASKQKKPGSKKRPKK